MDLLSQLAHDARRGDGAAMERFVKAAYDPVWRLCAAVVDPSSADDLAQETFLRSLRAIGDFRGDAPARAWILAIARHACMDELRSRTRLRHRDALVASAALIRAPDPGEQVAMGDLIRRLGTDRRLAFVLTQVVGLSYEGAASVCGCPLGTIRSRVARARADLLSQLAAAEDAPEERPAPSGSA